MRELQKKIKSTTNNFLIKINNKPVTIKQPNIMELKELYQAIMMNKKNVDAILGATQNGLSFYAAIPSAPSIVSCQI